MTAPTIAAPSAARPHITVLLHEAVDALLHPDADPHGPYVYGPFARALGRSVRTEGALPLAKAIHQLSALPAANLRLTGRGRLQPGYFADVVVFDPAAVQDHATFAQPHQYSTGVVHVLVNGVPVLRDGQHTNARPGRVVLGPGAAS